MIHDVDDSIRDLLESRVVGDANIDVAFDAPGKDWVGKRQGPAINCFLYDIREDLERRQVSPEAVRNTDGIVTARRTPPKRFKLSYLVSAWSPRPEDEHRMLSAVLELFLASDEFPVDFLSGRAADVGPVGVTIGLPSTAERATSSLWSALGGGPRPTLDLVITIPVGARTDPNVGPPVLEGPRVSLFGPDGERVPPRRRAGPPEAESSPTHPTPAELAARAEDSARPGEVTRDVVDAARFGRGSRIEELDQEDLKPGRRLGVSTIPRRPSQP